MSRHDRRRARQWTTGITVAAAGLAAWLLFFRGGEAASGTEVAKDPAPPVKIEPKPETKPVEKPAPAVAKKVEAAPVQKPVLVSAPPAPRQDSAPPWKYLLETGKLHEARRYMAETFAATDSDALRAEIADKGLALNKRLLVTQSDPRDIEFVTVASGENPTSIARRVKSLHGEPGLLFMLNGMRAGTVIRAGAKLRAPRGTFSLFVDKSLFKMWICYEGVPFKEYPVCIGADDKTPATSWTVGDKNPKPAWTAPPEWLEKEKGVRNPVEYGHPKNPLGEYWVALDAAGFQGFGIHGTNEPHTIGSKASNGCVRMVNTDVVELASCVWKGMIVTTVE